ncbi:MAG TPA: hypothetical protein ENJ37_02725 [Deltaproteobacteria bacterium]|nr:hypothetical protein [Deltaproteobacteria bacterium]
MSSSHSSSVRRAVVVALLIAVTCAAAATAAESEFRKEFVYNYKNYLFDKQVRLVKKNKDVLPAEVRLLIVEATTGEKSFEEKMYLLDIASAMASMYKHWVGGGDELIREIEAVQKKEIWLEEERIAEIMKWKKEERFLGNFVMKKHMKEMELEDLSPVLYPHWVHRIWYECKVCHLAIFNMKRWTNDISHEKFKEGRQCAACHDGKTAFATEDKEQCSRCHIAGRPEAQRLYKVKKVDNDRIRKVAQRIGAVWRPENLPGGELPLDRFKFIDWIKLKELNVFSPIVSLSSDFRDEIRDNKILFVTKNPIVKNVVFDHKVHSNWITCKACHPEVFKDDLTNNISMTDMSGGRFCGRCHGKVSFTFADCLRCHNTPKDAVLGKDVLRRDTAAEAAAPPASGP